MGQTPRPVIRTTTDRSNRMVFYFDEDRDGPAAMLAAFNDHRRAAPIVALAAAPPMALPPRDRCSTR